MSNAATDAGLRELRDFQIGTCLYGAPACISYTPDASYVEIRTNLHNQSRVGRGDRVAISGFSARSRRALLKTANRVISKAVPIFVTLTYHRAEVPPKQVKRDLDTFFQRLKRAYPHLSAIWKLEYQERGAPHFHLLVFGGRIPKTWLSEAWNAIAEPGDKQHLAAGTQVVRIRHRGGVIWYAAKRLGRYTSKAVEELPAYVEHPGRFWGVHNRSALPLNGLEQREISQEEAIWLIDYYRNKYGLKWVTRSLTVFETPASLVTPPPFPRGEPPLQNVRLRLKHVSRLDGAPNVDGLRDGAV